MSTNFYATPVATGEVIHLGKSSGGWKFLFHKTELFSSVAELVRWLETTPSVIADEYGQEIDPVEFMSVAIHNRNPGWTRSHSDETSGCFERAGSSRVWHDPGAYKDAAGHEWTTGEFF